MTDPREFCDFSNEELFDHITQHRDSIINLAKLNADVTNSPLSLEVRNRVAASPDFLKRLPRQLVMLFFPEQFTASEIEQILLA